MKKSTQTICIALIAGILAAVSIGAFILILTSDEPTIKDQISQAEQEKLDRQEQYKALWELKKETLPTTSRPTIPISITLDLPESPDLSISAPNHDVSFNALYEQIILMGRNQAEPCELRVGDSIRPESAKGLSGNQCCVYSSDEGVVTVSEDYTITAVAPGKTYVLFNDGETFLVYACVVTE